MKHLSKQQQQWIEDYCNEVITPEAFQEFEKSLKSDETLRVTFRQYLALDHELRQTSEDSNELISPLVNKADEEKVTPFPTGSVILALAACVAIGLFLAQRPSVSPVDQPAELRTELSAQGYGVFTSEEKAAWASHPDLEKGDLLPTGPIHLEKGIAQLELFSGVTLVVEGDAHFEIHSPMDMTVHSGRVRAHVPEPAQGFRLKSASGEIIDLGTEFAVDVTPAGSEIHVIDGEIEWYPSHTPDMRLMTKGQALHSKADGNETILVAKAADFAGMSTLTELPSSQRQQWLEKSRSISRDPRVVAYFPMSQPGEWKRHLFNESRQTEASTDGAIVAARRSSDRFGEAHSALDFSPTGSRVRLNVKRELTSLTLLAWVKIDSLDRWYNSLFLTDGHELNEPHWQIMDDGRLFFSIKAHNVNKAQGITKDKHIVYSPPFWTPALSGKWIQIATTFDGTTQTVTHYINGKTFHQETLPEHMQVSMINIGPATLGNWSDPSRNDDPHFYVRNLNGSIDEFALFSEALSPEEIVELHQNGKP